MKGNWLSFLLLIIIVAVVLTLPFFLGFKRQKKEVQLEVKEETKMVRLPAVAGAFYPAEKSDLIEQISSFLKKAEPIEIEKYLRILIVPHAGYDYSGQVAAWGFKQLENQGFSKVILLGSSHQVFFKEAAVYNQGRWQTPLGEVEIDEELANTLINQSELIKENLVAHEQEHSLEVELPFLQQVLGDFKMVAILLGQGGEKVLQDLTEAIANNLDEKTLLVISSDLSHYPPYEVANKVDKETIDSILSGEVDKFAQVIERNLNQPGVDTCACGAEAIKVGMLVAKKLGIEEIKLINYANSGDISGDQSRVVGYASVGFYSDRKLVTTKDTKLNQKAQKDLLKIARETLESYLKDGKVPEFDVNDEDLNEKLGAFVTLRKDGNLRGCIGEFEPKEPLYKVVQKKAIDAALNDPRFPPVAFDELKEIEIEISVLSKPEKIDDWKKIQLGKHGVIIRKGLKGGTFLPQVATETGWDLPTFLENLCSQKAGLAKDCYQDSSVNLFTFTAQVFSEEEKY